MRVVHKNIQIYLDINWYWSAIDLYPIKVIFYSIKVLHKVYNTNGLEHQNETQNIWTTEKLGPIMSG